MAFMLAYRLAKCELHKYYASGGVAGSRSDPAVAADGGTEAGAEAQCRYYDAAKVLRRTDSPDVTGQRQGERTPI